MHKLGITISAVKIKKSDQLLRYSASSPLKEARVVLLKLPREASKAYCVAEKACPVMTVKKDTNATVENAVVKLSTKIVARSRCSLGPTWAIQANIRLLADMAIPPIIKPRTIPNRTLNILPTNVNNMVTPQPISFE